LQPTIKFNGADRNYYHNSLGEVGVAVKQGFEYHSGTNPHFLTPEEIRIFNAQAMA
jgi:UDP-N-acetylglucosamine 4,6-dehydratase